MINKKAFTFAELMVSLVIIAVITALLYPTIAEISPNNNKQLYRSAYKTVELTVQDIITSNITFTSPHDLCLAFKDRLNTVGWTDTAGKSYTGCGDNSAAQEEIHTSNGMRWWFQGYDARTKTHTIYIDVNASNNGGDNFTSQGCGDACNKNINMDKDPDTGEEISGTGDPNPLKDPSNLLTLWPKGSFRVNNSTTRDTFKIQITDDGKVISDCDSIGARHLRDETE